MNLSKYLHAPSKLLALEAAIGSAAWRGGKRFLRKRVAPSLAELDEASEGTYADPIQLLSGARALEGTFDDTLISSLSGEFDLHSAELAKRYSGLSLEFPRDWAVEGGTSFLLYALVRAIRPPVVVEVGVANGQSSFFLLRALQENGSGRLHSFDIADGVGGLVDEPEAKYWDLVQLNPRDSLGELSSRLESLPPAKVSFHDADHGYLAQYAEFALLWDRLDQQGVLVCDDVDASFGLIDLARTRGSRPDLLVDTRKVTGVLRA